MKYLLSQDEYDTINQKYKHLKSESAIKINDLCMRIAINEPYLDDESGVCRHSDAGTFGCIRAEKREDRTTYCEGCPVEDICQYTNKRWSK